MVIAQAGMKMIVVLVLVVVIVVMVIIVEVVLARHVYWRGDQALKAIKTTRMIINERRFWTLCVSN